MSPSTSGRKRISTHDFNEVLKFKEYLQDRRTMTPSDFHRKYQAYEGLSDAELQVVLRKEAQ